MPPHVFPSRSSVIDYSPSSSAVFKRATLAALPNVALAPNNQ